MIPIERTAAVLLCAGLSTRFGEGDKLTEPLDGKPLLDHAAEVLAAMPFQRRIAVIGQSDPGLTGFDLMRNPHPEAGQDSSVRIGLAAALDQGAEAVVLALGDMPFVTEAHLRALLAAADPSTAAMSLNGDIRSPPAALPRTLCEKVLANPQAKVRDIIGSLARGVVAPAASLRDFDTREDFEA